MVVFHSYVSLQEGSSKPVIYQNWTNLQLNWGEVWELPGEEPTTGRERGPAGGAMEAMAQRSSSVLYIVYGGLIFYLLMIAHRDVRHAKVACL